MEALLDGGSDSSIWSRLASLFRRDDDEALKKAILVARADGEVAADEESMLLSILAIDDMQVQDIMTPRTDIACCPSQTSLLEIANFIVKSGHSRIPIYHETRDNIIGIVHAKDLLRYLIDQEKQSTPINEIMRAPFFVPETKGIRELLQEFRTRKLHIAVALDEYGGTSGIVSIEDVLEEIVGDIEDEHDTPKEEDIQTLGENCYEISGRTYLEDLGILNIFIESEEVDTIGGYLSLLAGHVPTKGETFTLNNWVFSVIEADVKFIRRIRVEKEVEQNTLAIEE